MELAYLSALLEHYQEGHHSKRFEAIRKFFESAVSAVPLESLFHAMANAKLDVMVQCCMIFCSCDTLTKIDFSSQWLLTLMKRASSRITFAHKRLLMTSPIENLNTERERQLHFELIRVPRTKQEEYSELFRRTSSLILPLLDRYEKGTDRPCNTDLEVIYSSADVKGPQKTNEKPLNNKAPLNLLREGRKKLNQLSEELIAEHSGYTDEASTSNTNIKMLSNLTNLRQEFETCSTLLGAFMESQVEIPLGKTGGEKYVRKFAKHASPIGLSVWGLLILPYEYLSRFIICEWSNKFRKPVVKFLDYIRGVRNRMFPPSEHQFPDYDERLEFLVGSMKQSSVTRNLQYVSYSLERQLQIECKNRNIDHHTSVDDILNQWNDNFYEERLTLVLQEYRCLVARWIKWSLMINNLRESLASQTAVGVIGLVNSGKSTFVRSLFGKEVSK